MGIVEFLQFVDPLSSRSPRARRWRFEAVTIPERADGHDLEVIYTPGEAADHICLLDRADRILFCGDILPYGPAWTHLEGGSLKDLLTSYKRLIGYFQEFDHLMPGHNQPWLDKDLPSQTVAGAEKILYGHAEPEDIIDPWNRPLKQYSFGRFAITTRQ